MDYSKFFDIIEETIEGDAHLDELAQEDQDPFKILISTILSARTKDNNTKEATIKLFSNYHTPKEIANAKIEDLEKLVYKAGFYKVKASRIKEVSKIIDQKYKGKVPDDFKSLESLPGVGAKTANCVLVYAFKKPAIPVDVHVNRISNRLGWAKTTKPEETEEELKKKLPQNQWIRVNRLFVRFGQEICLPINPKCEICPLGNLCPKDFSIEEMIKIKRSKKT